MKQVKNPDLVEMGQKLRNARKQNGLTQEQLAEKVGGTCTNTVISRYERGLVEMGSLTMCDLAKALNVSPVQLLPERLIHKQSDISLHSVGSQCARPTSDEGLDELLSKLDVDNREKTREYMKMLLFCQQHSKQTV